jgi:two-component system response regulator DesR
MKSIIIIEDHQVLRDSLTHILESKGEFKVVAQSSRASDAHQFCRRHQPDILLMDIITEDGDGLEKALQIKEAMPKQRIYLLSGLKEPDRVERAKEAGIDGYLLKDLPISQLLAKLRLHDAEMFPELEELTDEIPFELTRTELAILELLGMGHNVDSVAEELHYSPHTIKKYISRALLKSGCANRAMLLAHLTKSGHINPWRNQANEGE